VIPDTTLLRTPTVLRRRQLLAGLAAGVGLTTLAACLAPANAIPAPAPASGPADPHAAHHAAPSTDADPTPAPFANLDPFAYLGSFDAGRVSTLPDGRTLREFDLFLENRQVEVARGVSFRAWTFNGQVPGPTLRVTAGDRVRVNFVNGGDHLHSVHFHGTHAAAVDGGFESVAPGGSTTYEFDAEPFGVHLYHCHTGPLAKHLAKGLFGAYVVDPPGGRPPVDRELVMVQHGWDVDGDGENEFYAVNGPAFAYNESPIALKLGERVRVYLVNATEFDPVNSFHLHANFFDYYPTGTRLEPAEFTDTVVQGQGQRGILEFAYRFSGRYMFHAHKTEFAELGWMGIFEVKE
jgi:FtsP/CotA-like multicopper oxidase with cupredoxin domain